MTKVKALQLSFNKRTDEQLELLVRGVFWPFWPLRGKVLIHAQGVILKLPRQKEEVLAHHRVEHFLLDKLGAGVFVQIVLKPETTGAEETPEASDDEAPAAESDGTSMEQQEPAEAKPEKRYLGFFADPEDARALGDFVDRLQYKVVAWMGNWREKVGVVS